MKVAIVLGALAAAALVSGCFGGGQCGANTSGNGLQFGCQVANETDTKTYTFRNNFGAATVEMGSQIASGTLTVTVRDGGNDVVFTKSYTGASQGGDSTTRAGRPGTWTVVIQMNDVTGQIGLNVNGRAASPF